MPISMRRLTRLINGFSKKLDNYNMVRVHRTLRVTPAVAASVESRLWTLQELVEEPSK